MNYLLIVATLLALATSCAAGVRSCPYYDIPSILCYNNGDCASQSQATCKFYSGYNFGYCAAPERECASDETCYKYGNNFVCQKNTGATCTSNNQCIEQQTCINGKCGCPNIPDFGIPTCYVYNDAIGAQIGLTVCNNTGQSCVSASNKPLPYGSCASNKVDQPCDGGYECVGSVKCSDYQCKCKNPADIPKCKPYDKVKEVMIQFEQCIRIYTLACNGPAIETCCNVGIENCMYYLKQMGTLSNNNIDTYIKDKINRYFVTFAANSKICSYREYLSEVCGINYETASV